MWSRKKSDFLNGSAIKRGQGGKGLAIKKKVTFLGIFFLHLLKKFRCDIKLDGGGGLNGTVIKKRTFFAASLS